MTTQFDTAAEWVLEQLLVGAHGSIGCTIGHFTDSTELTPTLASLALVVRACEARGVRIEADIPSKSWVTFNLTAVKSEAGGLAELFGHIFDDAGHVRHQFRILRRLDTTRWVVALQSWDAGVPSAIVVYDESFLLDRSSVHLYTNERMMCEAYAARTERRKASPRDAEYRIVN